MMNTLAILFCICSVITGIEAFQCYNCTSFKQQSSCTEKNPLTSYLEKTSCSTNCYKWILYSFGNEVRRGCKVNGISPPGSSYAEYLCNNDLCNEAPYLSVSKEIMLSVLITSFICIFVVRN